MTHPSVKMSQVKCQITDLGLGRQLQLFSPSLSFKHLALCGRPPQESYDKDVFSALKLNILPLQVNAMKLKNHLASFLQGEKAKARPKRTKSQVNVFWSRCQRDGSCVAARGLHGGREQRMLRLGPTEPSNDTWSSTA